MSRVEISLGKVVASIGGKNILNIDQDQADKPIKLSVEAGTQPNEGILKADLDATKAIEVENVTKEEPGTGLKLSMEAGENGKAKLKLHPLKDSDITTALGYDPSKNLEIKDSTATEGHEGAELKLKIEDAEGQRQLSIEPLTDKNVVSALGYVPMPLEVYSFELDMNEVDPDNMIKYIGYNAEYTEAKMVYPTSGILAGDRDAATRYDSETQPIKAYHIGEDGAKEAIGYFDYGSWKNAWFIKDLKVVFLNYSGTVEYYLCPNNMRYRIINPDNDLPLDTCGHKCTTCTFCKQCTETELCSKASETDTAEGTTTMATKAGDGNGNVMIGIPTVWMKVDTTNARKPKFYFASQKVDDTYHAYAHTNYRGEVMPWLYVSAYDGWDDKVTEANGVGNAGTGGDASGDGRLRSLPNKIPTRTQTGQNQIKEARNNNPPYDDPEQGGAVGTNKAEIWDMGDFANHSLLAMLTLLITKNTNSQAVAGNGNMNGYNTHGLGVTTVATNFKKHLDTAYVAGDNGDIELVEALRTDLKNIENVYAAYAAAAKVGITPHKASDASVDTSDAGKAKAALDALMGSITKTAEATAAMAQLTAEVEAAKKAYAAAGKVTAPTATSDYDTNGVLRTGSMDEMGLFWGSNTDSLGVKMFGVEHLWGNVWKRTWGLINNHGKLYYKLTRGPYDGSAGTDYCTGECTDCTAEKTCDQCTKYSPSHNWLLFAGNAPSTGGYIAEMYAGDFGLLPKSTTIEQKNDGEAGGAGSATTRYCDYVWVANTQVYFALFGGDDDKYYNGLLATYAWTFLENRGVVTAADCFSIGASICCKPFRT